MEVLVGSGLFVIPGPLQAQNVLAAISQLLLDVAVNGVVLTHLDGKPVLTVMD